MKPTQFLNCRDRDTDQSPIFDEANEIDEDDIIIDPAQSDSDLDRIRDLDLEPEEEFDSNHALAEMSQTPIIPRSQILGPARDPKANPRRDDGQGRDPH